MKNEEPSRRGSTYRDFTSPYFPKKNVKKLLTNISAYDIL